ncbi:MAG: AMP-dependent synthetase and ligase, partial [Acidimicrobiales bacterium]|nr:AMP-dependent synthetase and ligase [Acidimicrobiales bacterium]
LFPEELEPEPWNEPDEGATATINYTSGTTARPKGVQLTHRNNWINATTFGLHTTISDRDVYLHTLPMFHANGWGMPYALTGVGARHVVLRKVDGADILRRVDEHGVTLLCGAPAVVNMVLDAAQSWDGEIPGRGRTRIVVAGAPPPTQTIERVETELGWEFIQIYGLTETAPLLTINRGRAEYDSLSPAERAQKLGRAGAPALGVKLDVDNEGEVLARANVVLEGYWEQPEETAKAIVDGWFHTGDGGALDDDGYLTISDRKKDVIISGGENISSIEVEDRLFSHPAVAEVCVIGVPHDKWGETVKALVVLKPDANVTEVELIEHCREGLAHYKCPTSVEFRTELARTATGKLQKFKLRASFWEGRDRKVN